MSLDAKYGSVRWQDFDHDQSMLLVCLLQALFGLGEMLSAES